MIQATPAGRKPRRRARSSLGVLAPRRPPLMLTSAAPSVPGVPVDDRRLTQQVQKEQQRARARAAAVARARDRIERARGRLAVIEAANRYLAEYRRR